MMQDIVARTCKIEIWAPYFSASVSPDLKTSADSGESPVAIKIFCSTQVHLPQ